MGLALHWKPGVCGPGCAGGCTRRPCFPQTLRILHRNFERLKLWKGSTQTASGPAWGGNFGGVRGQYAGSACTDPVGPVAHERQIRRSVACLWGCAFDSNCRGGKPLQRCRSVTISAYARITLTPIALAPRSPLTTWTLYGAVQSF